MAHPNGISVFAAAKINLFLHVGAKRADSFHALESLVVFAEVGDQLSLAHSQALTLHMNGSFAGALPANEENLVWRAARALGGERGAAITLEKNLPVASGLGGGSADAAAALRGLNVLWELERSEAELLAIAATLGSDVPACLLSRPLWMEGRGENVTRVPPLPPLSMLLINPHLELPTVDVFARVKGRSGIGKVKRPGANLKTLWDVTAYLIDASNDLEEPACALAPVIDEVLDALTEQPGCVLAQMSGSGPACFGLFDHRQSALHSAEALAHEHPNWWVRATRLADAQIGTPHWAK